MSLDEECWPHAPVHRLGESGVYMVTAGTLGKEHFFRGEKCLELLRDELLILAKQYDWHLEAWAVFSNHYHFVGRSPENDVDASGLVKFLRHLHGNTAREVNRMDRLSGRKVWHNYRETLLTYEKSYFARLNYVHQNPVKHGLVVNAVDYRWCSAAWFERVTEPSMVETIYRFKTDRLDVGDDY